MEVSRSQLDLIARTYDVVLSPAAWPEVLEQVSREVGARAVNVFVSDRVHPEIQVSSASAGIASDLLETYQKEYAHHEAPALGRLMTYPARQLVRSTELTGPDEALPSAQWLRQSVGIHRRVNTRLNDHPAWVDGVTFNLAARPEEYFTPEEEQVCHLLLPHLAKAVEISRPFQVLQARFRAALAALDRFQSGVMLLTEHGHVVLKNREADRILALADGLALDASGRPWARHSPKEDASLKAAIATSAATAQGGGLERESLLTIGRRSGADAFIIEISPILGSAHEFGGRLRGVLMLLVDPTHWSVISTRGMEQLYDLTSAEAAVLSLLAEGRGTSEIADERGTTTETVRSQIKSVFSKTGVKSRSALVRLALQVNLPIDEA